MRPAPTGDDVPAGLLPRGSFRVPLERRGSLELGRRTAVMGIVNVTPDSFSDGGLFVETDRAVERAVRLVESGADLLDIGGESTRPGAPRVDPGTESDRVLPVIEALRCVTELPISIDTRKAVVARQALAAGADLVNDVSGLDDPEMPEVLAGHRAPVVIMHMRGTPETMQRNTRYEDLLGTIHEFLTERIARAESAGLDGGRILVDPGLGFGKSLEGNLSILGNMGRLANLGRPILIGASRKSFLGRILDLPVDQRLEGSLAVAALASAQGAHVVRTHDVAETVRAVRVIDAVRESTGAAGR